MSDDEEIDISEIPRVVEYTPDEKRTTARVELLEKEEEIVAAYRAMAAKDFLCFARGLKIASVHGPQIFENCMAGFQRVCFEELAPSLQNVREGVKPEIQRWWIERTKKASKDADLAVIMLWLIAFPIRPLFMQVGAANKEQAGIVKDRITHILHWNPWLNDHVEMIHSVVRSKKKLDNGQPMAYLNVLSSDIAGAHGGTPDVLIINELSHITRWEFAENLMDNADGVANGLVIIATNAGFKGTKAEVWRNNAIRNDTWCVHVLAKPAPWHRKETIQDAKRRNPTSRYRRLWLGVWASGKGDALNEEHIDRCFCLNGPTLMPEPGWNYIAGLDLGISHDHSGLAIVGVHFKEQKIKLVYMKAWVPTKTGEVDLIDVEDTCKAMSRTYRLSALYYDPHQAKLMAQRLLRAGVPAQEMTFSSTTNVTNMANSLIQVVESGKLLCYDDEDGRLRRDFGKFNIVEKSYGFKLEAVSDEFGHADVGTALVITLPAALDILNGKLAYTAEDEVANVDMTELSKDEVESLPPELRDIYGAEEDIAKHAIKAVDPFDDFS